MSRNFTLIIYLISYFLVFILKKNINTVSSKTPKNIYGNHDSYFLAFILQK
jgi:hypothetical protein